MNKIVFLLAVIVSACSTKPAEHSDSNDSTRIKADSTVRSNDSRPTVDTGTFESAGMGDCFHLEFSFGDFGNAVRKLSPEEDKLWISLSKEENNEVIANPDLVGQTFEVTYTMIKGRTCGEEGYAEGQVQQVTGFRQVDNQPVAMVDEARTTLHFLGFSDDNRYVAFSIAWLPAYGAMLPSATLYILDVDKNDYAVKPFTDEQEDPEEQAHAKVMEMARPSLSANHIGMKRTGTRYTADANGAFTFPYQGGTRSLNLVTRDAPDGNKMFELQLLNSGSTLVLQSDKKTPESRGAVESYRIDSFYVQDNKIAVVIEYSSPKQQGFEGSQEFSTTQLMVTGVIQ